MLNLKFTDLLKIEKSFVKPVLEDINKSLKMIFEGKQVRLVGSDFDKSIIFYVDQNLKSAKFNLSEGKTKIFNIEDIKVDAESFKQQFESLMSEAIDDLAAEKLNEAESKFGKAVEIIRAELSGGKIDIFTKRPPLLKESKVAIKKIVKQDNKVDMKVLAEKAKELNESYYGKDIIAEEYYEISEGKAKHIENKQKEPSILCKVIAAKRESSNLNLVPMLENAEKFIAEHEEVFFITSDKLKTKLDEAAKKDVSATKEKVNEIVTFFKKARNASPEFRKIVATIMNEQNVPAEQDGQQGEQVPVTKAGLEGDLDDKVVSDMDRKTEEDKLGFMTQFVDILEKLFQKIKEVGSDDEDVMRRADFALDTIAKAKEEGKWDKDELSEIAREAIEVAAKLEGIEPEETAVSKAGEEAGEEEIKDTETIDNPQADAASVEVGAEGGAPKSEEEEEEENLASKEDEIEDELKEDDMNISSEGDVTYSDAQDQQADDEEQLDEIKCFACDEKFAVKKGRSSYKCPYCSEEVNSDMEEKTADELIPPGNEEELNEKKEKAKPFTIKAKPQPTVNKGEVEESVDSDDESSEEEVEDNATAEIEKPAEDAATDVAPEAGVEITDVSTEAPAETPGEETIEVSDTGTEKEIPIESIKAIIVKTEEPAEEVPADDSQEAYMRKWKEMQNVDEMGLPTNNAQQPLGESEMKTTPQPGKIESAGGEELKDSGPAMSKSPAKGKAEPADGTKLPDSGQKMSKHPARGKMKRLAGNPMGNKGTAGSTWPKVGKAEPAGGEEISDSGGTPMKTDATVGSAKNAGSNTKIPDTGTAMKTDATVGKVETLKESGPSSAGGEPISKIAEEFAPVSEVPIQEKEISSAPAKNADVLATYRSASNPDKRYYIVKGKDGVVYCTCPAWKFSGKGGELRNCKHLQDFKDSGSGVVKEMIEGVEEAFIREDYEASQGAEDESYPAIHQPAIPGQGEEAEDESYPAIHQPAIDEKYLGFKKLVKDLKSKGVKDEEEMNDEELNEGYQVYLKEGAEALAAWIGRKKYGKKKFQKMSAAGKKKDEGKEV